VKDSPALARIGHDPVDITWAQPRNAGVGRPLSIRIRKSCKIAFEFTCSEAGVAAGLVVALRARLSCNDKQPADR
jgi:hypothetical protein